jgi:hypothetical protein
VKIDYQKLFGNDSGEDEDPEVLDSYFVNLPQFARFNDPQQPLVLVRARKGMGKSALLSRLNHSLASPHQDNIVIKTTGNEMLGLGNFQLKGHAALENYWKQVICKRICMAIGKTVGFAMTDDSMSMVETAELEGFKGQNLLSALANRMGRTVQKTIQSLTGVGAEVEANKKPLLNSLEPLRRYQQSNDAMIWLLVDDIDAKYVDNEEYQERIAAFITAIRSLAFTVKNLRIRASIRTDVWFNLRRMEDQDKLRQYVIDIKWKDDALRTILAKKILSYVQRELSGREYDGWKVGANYRQIISLVFQDTFSWGRRLEEAFIPLKVLAGARPRWMGQLAKRAGENTAGRIGMDDLVAVMSEFGQEKMSDLQKEHQYQFADLAKLVDAFRGGQREYNRHQLISQINQRYAEKLETIPDVNGYPYKSPEQLGAFLFQIEFISARRQNSDRHMFYQDDPELFDTEESRQNKILWPISPSYRQYLRIV